MNFPKYQRWCLFAGFLFFISCSSDEEPSPSTLSISPVESLVGEDGEVFTISITSNSSWQANTNASWIAVSPISGYGNAEIEITIDPNANSDSREGTVRFSVEGLVKNLRIVQQEATAEVPGYFIPEDPTGMRDISSLELVKEMRNGWNVGNSLEAIGGETAWGNPKITKDLIDKVKAAGFNAVRIPVAWSKFTNEGNYEIDPAWMDRVSEVVDYVVANEMYAIINMHWDGGWMIPTYDHQEEVNNRMSKMWLQIALNFRDYDDHLLFAGTNEVMVEGDYGPPTSEYANVQNSYNQAFVDIVRSTGGRNAFRNLVVQTFNTNIDYGLNTFSMPEDSTTDRLVVEVHYYDPYQFTLENSEEVTQWGKNANNQEKTAGWADESYTDGQFQKMKTNFIDKGIPVIVGEYGAVSKKDLAHHSFRKYYLEYVSRSMKSRGIIPFFWDMGFDGEYGLALFDRATGAQLYPDLIRAIIDDN
jgi:endoglucanase